MSENGLDGNWDVLLEQMGINDPAYKQQLQMMAGLLSNNSDGTSDEAEKKEKVRILKRERARKRLRRLLREHEILLDLAAALGMCQTCFGATSACRLCHGRGGAGYLPPDEAAFNEIVIPVLEQMGLVQQDEPIGSDQHEEVANYGNTN